MAKVTWPSQDFSVASTTEVVMPGIDAGELGAVLRGQLVAMREHAGLGVAVADHLAGDRREHDGLARAGGRDAERVAAGGERSHAALDEGLLAGAQAHGRSPPHCAQLGRPAPGPAPGRGRGLAAAGGRRRAAAGRGPAAGRRRTASAPTVPISAA
jgi:hypothetical protein